MLLTALLVQGLVWICATDESASRRQQLSPQSMHYPFGILSGLYQHPAHSGLQGLGVWKGPAPKNPVQLGTQPFTVITNMQGEEALGPQPKEPLSRASSMAQNNIFWDGVRIGGQRFPDARDVNFDPRVQPFPVVTKEPFPVISSSALMGHKRNSLKKKHPPAHKKNSHLKAKEIKKKIKKNQNRVNGKKEKCFYKTLKKMQQEMSRNYTNNSPVEKVIRKYTAKSMNGVAGTPGKSSGKSSGAADIKYLTLKKLQLSMRNSYNKDSPVETEISKYPAMRKLNSAAEKGSDSILDVKQGLKDYQQRLAQEAIKGSKKKNRKRKQSSHQEHRIIHFLELLKHTDHNNADDTDHNNEDDTDHNNVDDEDDVDDEEEERNHAKMTVNKFQSKNKEQKKQAESEETGTKRVMQVLQTGLNVQPTSDVDSQPISGELPHGPFHPLQLGIQPSAYDFKPGGDDAGTAKLINVAPTKRENTYPGLGDYDLTPEKILEANAKMESMLPIADDENHNPDFRNEERNSLPENSIMPEMHQMAIGQRILNSGNQPMVISKPGNPITDMNLVSTPEAEGYTGLVNGGIVKARQALANKQVSHPEPAKNAFQHAIEEIQNKENNIGSEVKTALEDAVEKNEETKDNSLVNGMESGIASEHLSEHRSEEQLENTPKENFGASSTLETVSDQPEDPSDPSQLVKSTMDEIKNKENDINGEVAEILGKKPNADTIPLNSDEGPSEATDETLIQKGMDDSQRGIDDSGNQHNDSNETINDSVGAVNADGRSRVNQHQSQQNNN